MIKFLRFLGRLCIPAFIYSSYHPSEGSQIITLSLAAVFIIYEIIALFCSETDGSKEKKGKKLRRIKVLCIDDDHISRNLLKKMIMKISPNIDLRMATDGDQGLQMIKLVEPDIIFLDMMMDKMNGNVMAKKAQSRFPKFLDRIVVLTSLDSSSDEVTETIYLGCDYAKKPISPENIRTAMNKVLDRYKLRANLNEPVN
jgi:two-component system response regulator DctR